MVFSICVCVIFNGDVIEVQILIQYFMDIGFVKDFKGELILLYYIQQFMFEWNGKVVFVVDWGIVVFKDFYVKFSFKGVKKGDDFKIFWIDNKGGLDMFIVKIV